VVVVVPVLVIDFELVAVFVVTPVFVVDPD
jgi:hypothetical protein